MIYESFPWKQDLLQRKRLILKYNHSELLSEENDRAYTVIEKAIFYSAFIIRKLIDCKGKVSDEVDAYKFRIKGIRPIKEINLLNRWPDEDNYDWKHETVYTKSGTELCNIVSSLLIMRIWKLTAFLFHLIMTEIKCSIVLN